MKVLLQVCLLFCALAVQAQQSYKLRQVVEGISSGITCLATNETGDEVMAGDQAGNLYRIGIDGRMQQKVQGHSKAVRGFSFNSTGRLLLSFSPHDLKIWNASTFKTMHVLDHQEYADIRFGVFSIADGFIYFNSGSRLYKTRSDLSQAVVRLFDFTESISGGVITPDRSVLIFSAGNKLRMINTRSDNIIQEIQVSAAPVENLALVPGNRLATWSTDGTVTLWSIRFGQLVQEPLVRFKAGVSSPMAFSSGGEWMASGNIGTWVRIWDWSNRSIKQELFGHTATVTSVAFAAGDELVFTGSEDKTLRIWSRGEVPVEVKPPPPPPTPVAIAKEPAVVDTQAVRFNEHNIPVQVMGRTVTQSETFAVNTDTLELFIYDNSALDGDTVSLSFNGQWILKDYGVARAKKRLLLRLQKGNNSLVLYAENLGSTPPNTAAVEFLFDGRKKIIRLKSDLKSSSALNFVFK